MNLSNGGVVKKHFNFLRSKNPSPGGGCQFFCAFKNPIPLRGMSILSFTKRIFYKEEITILSFTKRIFYKGAMSILEFTKRIFYKGMIGSVLGWVIARANDYVIYVIIYMRYAEKYNPNRQTGPRL
jgi:hypothetical protein